MKTIVYIAQSLDGFIAGPNGELGWLECVNNPENSDFGFAQFMSGVDALLMGRNTFEKVASFDSWPYEKPVYVASQTLKALPSGFEDKAFLITGTLTSMLSSLALKGISSLYIDGGKLIQSALASNEIDELIITTVPIILGDGIRLFAKSEQPIALTLIRSEILLGQLVKNQYLVCK